MLYLTVSIAVALFVQQAECTGFMKDEAEMRHIPATGASFEFYQQEVITEEILVVKQKNITILESYELKTTFQHTENMTITSAETHSMERKPVKSVYFIWISIYFHHSFFLYTACSVYCENRTVEGRPEIVCRASDSGSFFSINNTVIGNQQSQSKSVSHRIATFP